MNQQNTSGVSEHTGFPNPATDVTLKDIDLNALLIKHPVGTYYMRIAGNDWREHGVFDGDIALIDRVLSPQRNDLVAWWHQGTFALSLCHRVPADATIWGVVTTIIHQYKNPKSP